MTLETTTALITGASQGLGRALALELGRRRVRLVLVARGRPELEAVRDEIARGGGEAYAIAADIGDPDAAALIAGQARALVGDIDLVVHNASTLGALPMPLLADTNPTDLEHVFQVNTFGPFRLTRALVGAMLLGGSGVVVSISSDAAVEAYPHWGAYAASKAALDHLSRIWAAELEDTGVRFVAVDPGEMNTRMHADAMPEADRSTLADPAQVASRIAALLEDPPAADRVAIGAA